MRLERFDSAGFLHRIFFTCTLLKDVLQRQLERRRALLQHCFERVVSHMLECERLMAMLSLDLTLACTLGCSAAANCDIFSTSEQECNNLILLHQPVSSHTVVCERLVCCLPGARALALAELKRAARSATHDVRCSGLIARQTLARCNGREFIVCDAFFPTVPASHLAGTADLPHTWETEMLALSRFKSIDETASTLVTCVNRAGIRYEAARGKQSHADVIP